MSYSKAEGLRDDTVLGYDGQSTSQHIFRCPIFARSVRKSISSTISEPRTHWRILAAHTIVLVVEDRVDFLEIAVTCRPHGTFLGRRSWCNRRISKQMYWRPVSRLVASSLPKSIPWRTTSLHQQYASLAGSVGSGTKGRA